MQLWLLRHGEASPLAEEDFERELTMDGREEVEKTAALLQGEKIDLILHSPYVRAEQTTQILCELLNYKGKVKEVNWITPDDDPKEAAGKLADIEESNVLVVSHQPLLGKLTSLFVGGDQYNYFPFKTAGLKRLTGDYLALSSMQVIEY